MITWYNGSRPFAEQPAGQVALQASLSNLREKQFFSKVVTGKFSWRNSDSKGLKNFYIVADLETFFYLQRETIESILSRIVACDN